MNYAGERRDPPDDQHVPPVEEPPENPDVQPNAPVREPDPAGPTRM